MVSTNDGIYKIIEPLRHKFSNNYCRRKQPTAWSSSEQESDSEVPVRKSTKTSRSSSSAQKATFPSAPVVPNLPVTQSSTDVVDVDDDVHTQDSLHDDATEISFHSPQTSSPG